jgi:NAD(P)-dependent dehydrogenase (short-subunit alcohol dehydrogenase family)
MTGFLAADLAAKKGTVNAIVPGLVGTEFRQIWAKELGERQGKSTEEFVGEFCKSKGILLERWAEVSEIGDLVVFLASDRASYIRREDTNRWRVQHKFAVIHCGKTASSHHTQQFQSKGFILAPHRQPTQT